MEYALCCVDLDCIDVQQPFTQTLILYVCKVLVLNFDATRVHCGAENLSAPNINNEQCLLRTKHPVPRNSGHAQHILSLEATI